MTGPDDRLSCDESLSEDSSLTGQLDRRSFLRRSGGAALATAAALAGMPLALAKELTRESSFAVFSADQAVTVAAVLEHLFPKDSASPGAADINATTYLESAITAPRLDPDTRNIVVNGIGRLTGACRERYNKQFHTLADEQKEQLLRYLADNTRWGRGWLSLLLYYIFEALLADPAYGGNPDQIGWRWLQHQPGFPRPPADKAYGNT